MKNEEKHPVIEKEVKEEDIDEVEQSDINNVNEFTGDKEELEKLKNNPYTYIRSFYEKVLPHVGGKVFSILAFLPLSMYIPKLLVNNRQIKTNLNLLWLSPSGMGKSTIAREFYKIAFGPILTKEMSTVRLEKELEKRRRSSLIIEDVSVWFADEEKIKFLEGISGEEQMISRETMRNIKKGTNRHVNCVVFCSGTAENITNNKIHTGILRRFAPLIIYLTAEEHKDVLKFIHNGVGVFKKEVDSSHIKRFYDELDIIQSGYNKDIKPIDGYIIPEDIKEFASSSFIPMTETLHKKYRMSLATESEQMWRFAICHAFLDLFNKHKRGLIQDNKIVIEHQDIEVAKNLIAREINYKTIILQCIDNIDYYNIRTREQLIEWEENRRIAGKKTPMEAKFIMESNVRK